MTERASTPKSFEGALEELEGLVEKMEQGELSLEDSVAAYERGVVLHRYCEKELSDAERKIRILAEGGGEEALQPFEPERGGAEGGGAPDDDGLPF